LLLLDLLFVDSSPKKRVVIDELVFVFVGSVEKEIEIGETADDI